ncbi:hypothetical protein C8Q72DRAFT_884713 [Fomitopsis betulina]|nr:hypothetical protein C8Q72DRAFT_884713 [Fomitopsis betulina]
MPFPGSRAAGSATSRTTPSDASRIQSTQAKSGGDVGKGSFTSRIQRAAARNTSPSGTPATLAHSAAPGAKVGKGAK